MSFIIYCGFFPYPFPTNTSHSTIYETIMRQNIDWPQRHELMIAKDEEHRLGIYLTRNLPQRLLIFFVAKAFVRTLLQKDPSVRAESAQALLHPVSIANIKIWDVFN